MCRLAYIPLLLLGWANLIDKSTQVAQPQATLFNKPLKPFSLGESYATFRLPNAIRYYPERAFHPFYAEADVFSLSDLHGIIFNIFCALDYDTQFFLYLYMFH